MIKAKIQKLLRFILFGSVCICCSIVLDAQNIPPSQIIFLHLKMKSDSITLISSSVKNGKLKEHRMPDETGKIFFVVESNEGAQFYTNVINNPLVQRYEYPRNDQGELGTTIEKKNEAEFWIRIPMKEGIERIAFYRIDTAQIANVNKYDKTLLQKIDLKLSNVRSK